MNTKVMNPKSTMMQQSEGMWMKYVGLILNKLAPEGVTITVKDMEKIAEGEGRVVLVQGHYDSIEFKLVTPEEAERISKYDSQQRGRA